MCQLYSPGIVTYYLSISFLVCKMEHLMHVYLLHGFMAHVKPLKILCMVAQLIRQNVLVQKVQKVDQNLGWESDSSRSRSQLYNLLAAFSTTWFSFTIKWREIKFNCLTGTQLSICSTGSPQYILAIRISTDIIHQVSIGDYFHSSYKLNNTLI